MNTFLFLGERFSNETLKSMVQIDQSESTVNLILKEKEIETVRFLSISSALCDEL